MMGANGPGRIDPGGLNQQIQSWQTPVQPQVQAAPKAAAPPPAGPTGFWGRISQVGIGKLNLLNAYKVSTAAPGVALTTAARVLPGGQNDIKARQQAVLSSNKTTQNIKTLQKSGKITSPQAAKLLQSNANNDNQSSQEAHADVQSGTVASQSKQGVQMLEAVPKAVVDVGKKAGEQIKYLSSPTNTERGLPGGNKITKNQTAASKNPEYLKAAQNIKSPVGAGATIHAQDMASKGAKAPEIQDYLAKQAAAYSANTKRGVGDLATIASVDTGGGVLLKQAGKMIFGKEASTALAKNVATNRLVKAGQDANKVKIAVTDASSGEIKGKVSEALPKSRVPIPVTSGRPSDAGYTDAEFRAQFNSGAKQVVKNNPETAGAYMKTGSKDPLTLTVHALSSSNSKSKISASIDKLIPDMEAAPKNQLIKALKTNKDPQETAHLLWDAAKNHETAADAKLNMAGTPMTKKVTFEDAPTSSGVNAIKTDAKKLAGNTSKKAQAAEVTTPPKTASLSQKVSRPAGEKVPPEPLVDTNKAPAKGMLAKLQGKGAGTLNPELGAARQGNTDFASTIRDISSGDVKASYRANSTADKFAGMYDTYIKQGGSHANFIKDVEGGKLGTQAHDFWVSHFKEMGSKLQETGVLKNGARDSSYVPRIAKFTDKGGGGSMGGLRKTGGFAKGRAQTESGILGEPGSDLYKTHGEYKTAVEGQGGKVLSHPVEIMRQSTAARLKAINHAEGLAKLDKTAMRDGRASTITFSQEHGLPPGYRDYNTSLLPGRAVHPEAVKGVEALVKTPGGNQLERGFAKYNSTAKRLVTLNGLVHGKNFALASIREQGLRGTATAFKNYAEADVNRAIEHGFVPSRAGMTNIFDEANDGKGSLGRATSVLGKVYEKSQKTLFEGFGDKLGMNTYLNVEKQLVKQGLSHDEAGKIAADAANRVIFAQRATETSQALKEASRVAFFAGKFFQATMAVGTKVTGLGKNNLLSEAAQKAEQRMAAKSFARGFTYLFGAAQAINYATTGHSTFQNKDSKLSPVFYVDKSTGKEYHITNFYGQIGELLNMGSGNITKTAINKLSPGLQEGARIITNTDPYKGTTIRDKNASGARQTVQVFVNALENAATPLGFQTSTLNQTFGKGAQPGAVSGAKFLGYGTSTKDQNRLEREVDAKYSATLPQGQGSSQDASLMKAEATARHDIKTGKIDSPALQKVKGAMSDAAYKKFVKGGAVSDTQRHFDSLPTEQKLQLIDKYSPAQLKELNLDGVAKSLVSSSAKTSVQSLESKGYTPQKIQQLLEKAGYGQSQLQQVKDEARRQAAQAARRGRGQPKWQNPLLK